MVTAWRGAASPDLCEKYVPEIDIFRNLNKIASGHQNWIQNRTEDKKLP